MRNLPKPSRRSVRVARRIGARVGIRMGIRIFLIQLLGVSSPLIPLFTGCTWIVLGVWVNIVLLVSVIVGLIVWIGSDILLQNEDLALWLTIGTVFVYYAVALYVHWRLFRWWLRRLLR